MPHPEISLTASRHALHRHGWLVILLALVPLGCDHGSEPGDVAGPTRGADRAPRSDAETPAEGNVRVVFLGDSITAGYELPEAEAYPALVESRLAEAGHPIQLLNAGVSGDTTEGALRRLDWVLRDTPDIVVIQLGANDAFRATDPATIEANLIRLIERIQERDITPVLLGMRIPPSYGEDYAERFAQLYDRVAQQTAVAYQPFFMSEVAGHPELNLEDGIHPNAQGHEKLAERVVELLTPILARQ